MGRELEQRTKQLESSKQELESFSYSVSHDLKAPIRHIAGYTALLEKKYSNLLPNEGKKYISNILLSSNKMGVLIDGLLSFSRSGRVEMKTVFLDMNKIVNDLIQPIIEQDNKNRIKFHVETLPAVNGDLSMLITVWGNLIENAVKFTKNEDLAEITIKSKIENNKNVYYITDNGAGFDMKYASKLFAVFQRLHIENDFAGTGIGLANVKRIITKHGGEIWADGKIGVGATFYFTID